MAFSCTCLIEFAEESRWEGSEMRPRVWVSVVCESMSSALSGGGKRHVVYYHNPEVGNFHYGPKHPMKPHRLALTHSLVMEYGLLDKMDVYVPKRATYEELTQFHTPEYLDWLLGYALKVPKALKVLRIGALPLAPNFGL